MFKNIYELWDYRTFFLTLVMSELRTRYKGSILGFLWTFINPLLILFVYYVVFTMVMKVRLSNYAMFLFIGILSWNMMSSGILSSISIITRQSGLIKKIYFPRVILPLSVVSASMINYLFSLIVLIPLLLVAKLYPNINWIYLPVVFLIQMLIASGISLLLSSINVFIRDVEHVMGIIFMLLFYLTPIVYTLNMVPLNYHLLIKLNPFSDVVLADQSIFYYGQPPHWKMLIYSFIISILVFSLGYTLFLKLNRKFAEEI
jgi:ABC-2 type transport system permease protein